MDCKNGYDRVITGWTDPFAGDADPGWRNMVADIDQLFPSAMQVKELSGVILNPWNRTLMLDKTLMKLVLG